MVVVEEEAVQRGGRGPHLKKRALKNKALSVSFDEKDLRDYVSGFHKRKKKRRKEAHKQQERALRRTRIENRKKRKLEIEFSLFGGVPPTADSQPDEYQVESVAGTKTYENADVKVTVVTSEINPEEEEEEERKETPLSSHSHPDKSQGVPIIINSRKPFKKVAKQRSRPKLSSKRDKKKGKKRGNK